MFISGPLAIPKFTFERRPMRQLQNFSIPPLISTDVMPTIASTPVPSTSTSSAGKAYKKIYKVPKIYLHSTYY